MFAGTDVVRFDSGGG